MHGFSHRLSMVVLIMGQVAAAHSEPVARIVAVSGKITVTSERADRSAGVLDGLSAGEKLSFAPKSALVLAWPASHRVERWTATGDGKAHAMVTAKGLEGTSGLKMLKIPRKLDRNLFKGVASISPGAVTIARSGDEPAPPQIEPIFDATIPSVRPEFSWSAAPGVARYEIRLHRRADLIWKADTDATRISMPSSQSLARGGDYRWEVIAAGDDKTGKVLTTSKFRVASKTEAAEFEAAKQLETSLKDKDFDCVPLLVLIATCYEDLKLASEAIRVYERLAKLSAETAALHAALYELYHQAGRTKDAAKSRKVAKDLGFKFDE